MRLHTSKSKNAESFYISKGYVNDKGVSTSVIVRKLGTLKELLPEHGPTRDDVVAWCKEQCKLETLKYKGEQKSKSIQITFHANRQICYDQQVFYRGGYLFLQSFYYQLHLDKTCRKLRDKLTDKLHEICSFRTDYEFITKKDMKTIQKKVKVDNKLLYFKMRQCR